MKRFHIHIAVNDLEENIRFYTGLINQKNGLFHDTPGALGISGL